METVSKVAVEKLRSAHVYVMSAIAEIENNDLMYRAIHGQTNADTVTTQ